MVMESAWLQPCFQAHDNVYICKEQRGHRKFDHRVLKLVSGCGYKSLEILSLTC